jgi:nucleotidyltransferase substrate binding protein (TIGR01987 family)
LTLQLEPMRKAITLLKGVLERANNTELMSSLDDITRYGLKSGAIQNFEFTYELCWKFIKRWLEENLGSSYVDGVSRRELFRLAAENKLINDVDLWMDFHHARNQTSHIYDEAKAEMVFDTANRFVHDAERLLDAIEARND